MHCIVLFHLKIDCVRLHQAMKMMPCLCREEKRRQRFGGRVGPRVRVTFQRVTHRTNSSIVVALSVWRKANSQPLVFREKSVGTYILCAFFWIVWRYASTPRNLIPVSISGIPRPGSADAQTSQVDRPIGPCLRVLACICRGYARSDGD